jgi:tight adherence protein B
MILSFSIFFIILLSLCSNDEIQFLFTSLGKSIATIRKYSKKRSDLGKDDILFKLSQIDEGLNSGLPVRAAFAVALKLPSLNYNFSNNLMDKGFLKAAKVNIHKALLISKCCFVTIKISDSLGISASKMMKSLIYSLKKYSRGIDYLDVSITGPKSTIKLLKILPLLGIGLGFILGVNSIGILLDGGFGTICLILGSIFLLLGHLWTKNMISKIVNEIQG